MDMHKKIDSLYLHFPFCTHLCNYCDFYKKVPKDKVVEFSQYQKYLEDSFEEHLNLIKTYDYSFDKLKTLYIGGGTPSLWGKEGKLFLEAFLKNRGIYLDTDCEFTLEVNPGAWTEESLNEWRKFGANRFSLGIQSFNAEMIKYLDRVHNLEDVKETLEYFKKNELNFSVDFMLGLPFSSENQRDIISELEIIKNFNPSHFSVYILTVKDNYPHFNNLPEEDWIEKEYLRVAENLSKSGYFHYEVSNFCLPNKHSIHNMNYWESKTVAAFGPSATGFLSKDKIRYKWKPNTPKFDIEILTEEEFKLEEIYMGLRSMKGIDLSNIKNHFLPLFENWETRQLGNIQDNIFRLNSKGYLILDSLINELFSKKFL